MERSNAVLHPGHYLALSQDQDYRARQDKTKEGEEGDDKLQELQRKDSIEQLAADIITK